MMRTMSAAVLREGASEGEARMGRQEGGLGTKKEDLSRNSIICTSTSVKPECSLKLSMEWKWGSKRYLKRMYMKRSSGPFKMRVSMMWL
jgi:hypothetical protein